MIGTKLRATLGLAVAQLRDHRTRTALAVLGVALAVLLVVLLVGLGYSVVTVGERGITALDQDFWVTGGPVGLQPTSVGGVENRIVDAHRVVGGMAAHPGVAGATALSFQTVYAGPDESELRTVVGVGIAERGSGSAVVVKNGRGFSTGDVHYANGSYDGNMTREVVIDDRTAAMFDVGVGDTLHVGGTLAAARRNEFEVVGISRNIERFLGTPTATLHLSELQEVSASTGTDRAAVILLTLEEGADRDAVRRDLQAQYPTFEFRTTQEQFRAVLGRQSLLVASAVTLVLLAVSAGVALVVNILATLVYQQRDQLAALKAGGVGSRTLVRLVAGQGLLVGVLGGALGLATAPLVVEGLNTVVARVVGFPNLVSLPPWVFLAGGGLAVGMGLLGSTVAGWRVARLSPLAHLER